MYLGLLHVFLLATGLSGLANGLKCKCDAHLAQMLDTQLLSKMPTLPTPVCNSGVCDITEYVPTGGVPLCSHLVSSIGSGYYCTAGPNAEPSTVESGMGTVKFTHCTTDNCDAKPAGGGGGGGGGSGGASALSAVAVGWLVAAYLAVSQLAS